MKTKAQNYFRLNRLGLVMSKGPRLITSIAANLSDIVRVSLGVSTLYLFLSRTRFQGERIKETRPTPIKSRARQRMT